MKNFIGCLKGRTTKVLGVASTALVALPSVAFASETPAMDVSAMMGTAMGSVASDFGKALVVVIPIAFGIYAGPKVIKLVMKVFNSLTAKG